MSTSSVWLRRVSDARPYRVTISYPADAGLLGGEVHRSSKQREVTSSSAAVCCSLLLARRDTAVSAQSTTGFVAICFLQVRASREMHHQVFAQVVFDPHSVVRRLLRHAAASGETLRRVVRAIYAYTEVVLAISRIVGQRTGS
jgi:hypothetical protein